MNAKALLHGAAVNLRIAVGVVLQVVEFDNMRREDVLPKMPERMAVRTARQVYLYVKTRYIREGRLGD